MVIKKLWLKVIAPEVVSSPRTHDTLFFQKEFYSIVLITTQKNRTKGNKMNEDCWFTAYTLTRSLWISRQVACKSAKKWS